MGSKKFDVDLALDTIDYSFPWYQPTEQALEFFNLMRLVQGKDFEFGTPMLHFFMVDVLFGNVNVKQFPYSQEVKETIAINIKRIAMMASRGLAKSTVVTTFMPVYLAIKGELPNYGNVYFMLGIAASAQGGGRVMCKAIQSLCQDSVFCQNYFEDMRFTETESEFTRKGKGDLNSRTFLFRAMGFSGGIRGTRSNVGANRPDIIAFDDTILNTAAAYSETQMDTLEEIMAADAENALKGGGNGRVWVIFTPFHAGDPNYKIISGGAYTPLVFPICEKIDNDTTAENIKTAWSSMHPPEAIISQYRQAKAAGKLQSFMQERMLRVSSEEERLIPEYMLSWYDSRSLIMKNIQNFTIVITTDFTAGNTKNSDYSGIAVWAINANNDKYLVELFLEKCTIQEQYEALFKIVSRWSNKGASLEVGIEIDGQQQLNINRLDAMMIEKNIWFRYARQKGKSPNQIGIRSRGNGNKMDRIRNALPDFEMNRIKFPRELEDSPQMKEMLDELRKISRSGFGALHDDGIDLVSQLMLIDYTLPSGNVPSKEEMIVDNNDMWALGIDDDEEFTDSEIF